MEQEVDLETVPCPLCGSDRSRELLTSKDWRHGCPGEFRYVRCLECSLVYANPRVRADRIGRYYPNSYAPFSDGTVRLFGDEEREARFKRLRRLALARRTGGRIGSIDFGQGPIFPQRLLGRVVGWTVTCRKSPLHFGGKGLRLLDVGCGTGGFLRQMQSLGWVVEGIEPDERAAACCRQHGLEVTRHAIETAPLPAGHFDVVTVWQTIEHLADPMTALRKIETALVPGGLLVGNTPNEASWNRRRQAAYWWGYDPPRHYVVFSPGSLSYAFACAGLQMRWRYCLSSIKGVTTARAFRAKALGLPPKQSTTPIPSFVLRLWVRLVDRLGLGDNLWFVGQKPFGR